MRSPFHAWVSITSFVYSSQKCDSNYPFANSACRCHDSTTCPSGGCSDSGEPYFNDASQRLKEDG